MPSHPEGLAIAHARIAAEKIARTGTLDLGVLGLVGLPEELWELDHLEVLNLGLGWRDLEGKWLAAQSDIDRNIIGDSLGKLALLPRLLSLSLNRCESLESISGLQLCKGLQTLDCSSTQVSDLSPLANLQSLHSLQCYDTQVSDLSPLANLPSLQSLDCSSTLVSDLSHLAKLQSLRKLNCRSTQVDNLNPLAPLPSLHYLECWNTKIKNLSPLAHVLSLQYLDCDNTQVSDLSALAYLPRLQHLRCWNTGVLELPFALLWKQTLTELQFACAAFTQAPQELLSKDPADNCLPRLRAHFKDLEAGEALLTDVKLLVLGNGRIGKTQLCRRLRGEPFEEHAKSTHGIIVTKAPLPGPSEKEHLELHLWDFGGQDLYHGTHALFMRTRSLFLLMWTPRSEDESTHEHGGMTFRNHRLPYWLAYVRHLAGKDCPVLVVQNQCDAPRDERRTSPIPEAAAADLDFYVERHYSAKTERGRSTLLESLREAVTHLRQRQGQARIGKGRMAVKLALEKWRDEDAQCPAAQRRHRTVSQTEFHQLCEDAQNVSSPEMLLDYLHHTGLVFYQKGLFGDAIVLDQAWALEAVYTIFHRQQCYRQLQQFGGRFTRSFLGALAWQNYSEKEQELFLSLMVQCGICFVLRRENKEDGMEAEYLAPDLLPDRARATLRWDEAAPTEQQVLEFPFLHPGVMRALISAIGTQAGIDADYWRNGLCLYEARTRSQAMIEQEILEDQGWAGRIILRTQGGDAAALLCSLEQWVEKAAHDAGLRDWKLPTDRETTRNQRELCPPPASSVPRAADLATPSAPTSHLPPLAIAPPPAPPGQISYAVSYSWRDAGASREIVDKLCQAARDRGIRVLLDTNDIKLGDDLTRFMKYLSQHDRVFVILSEGYLKSENCMYEFYQMWIYSRQNIEEFRRRVRVYLMPDVRIGTLEDRLGWSKHWRDRLKKLQALLEDMGSPPLDEGNAAEYHMMHQFAEHVAAMLHCLATQLQPQSFEDLKRHGLTEA